MPKKKKPAPEPPELPDRYLKQKLETIFVCDPYKNVDCDKVGCYLTGGPCRTTTKLKYAKIRRPSDYAELQKQQTADIYARVDPDEVLRGNK